MQQIKKVLVAGSGAVGSAIASLIEDSLPGCVSVLADVSRMKRYQRDGFWVNGRHYAFPVAPVPAGLEQAAVDLVIIAVKYHHLELVLEQLRGYVGPQTLLLSLLNGISSEQLIGQKYGGGPGAPPGVRTPVLGMILGIDAVRDGCRTSFASTGKIHFGEELNVPGNYTERVACIQDFFDRAGISYVIPENMLRTLWFKFMINVGINQTSAVLRATYKPFQSAGPAQSVMLEAMRELIRVARAEGIGLGEDDLTRWLQTLAGLNPDNLTSMCQDVLAGRKTEVEMLAGEVLKLGRKHAIETPVNGVLFDLIKAMEQGYGVA